MRQLPLIALCVALFAAPGHVQTSGVPFLNDYTIGGMTSASTSCTPLSFLGGGPVTFTVSASSPGLPYFIFATVGSGGAPCCRPCFLTLLPSTCAIPPGALCPSTNQTVDIFIGGGCTWVPPASGVTGAGGIGSMIITLPPGISFGTQAGIFDPTCNGGSIPLTLTQAYDVRT